MRRIYAVAGVAVLGACLVGWSALAWARPGQGKQVPPGDLVLPPVPLGPGSAPQLPATAAPARSEATPPPADPPPLPLTMPQPVA